MDTDKHLLTRIAEWRNGGREEPFEMRMSIWESKNSVKTHLPKVSFDRYDGELPDSVVIEYNPPAHNLRINLPEPQNNTTEDE